MNFCTVLYSLKSPQNVGMIVRSHVAHDGQFVLFTGNSLPWEFKKASDSFSRKLQMQTEIIHIPEPSKAVEFLRSKGYSLISVEISENSTSISDFEFPSSVALILGNEANGLPLDILEQSDSVVTIPQYGDVASLNVAVSASIAMYELKRRSASREIRGDEFV